MEGVIDDAFDAVFEGSEEKLRGMLRHINPNMTAEHGFSLLMMAAQTAEVSIMKLLLDATCRRQQDPTMTTAGQPYITWQNHPRPAKRPGISWLPQGHNHI